MFCKKARTYCTLFLGSERPRKGEEGGSKAVLHRRMSGPPAQVGYVPGALPAVEGVRSNRKAHQALWLDRCGTVPSLRDQDPFGRDSEGFRSKAGLLGVAWSPQ